MSAGDDCAARWDGGNLVLQVRVQPRASRNEILGVSDAQLRVRTTAPPVDGKANKAVIRLLADYLQVPPSRIRLTHGTTHRNKRFIIDGPVRIPHGLPVASRASNGL
ncbi:MAG: DUF167 domain-containing protein [Gammaproteobacteria bacterium]|nr:DUF167 domain-containing protein [Gammaproteobacteria bacterium]MDH3751019.1 DUF167 domain-containing protein [Gammaproteobacteria bacterium]MDH3804816.1 DUF167 domain-containing protein [Gammaproteobacteria bacterium]